MVLTEGGLPPSIRWLQVLGLAVAGSGGLTVGSLCAALGSADASVHRLAEKVRACVLEPACLEARQLCWPIQHVPPAACLVGPRPAASMFNCWQKAPNGG